MQHGASPHPTPSYEPLLEPWYSPYVPRAAPLALSPHSALWVWILHSAERSLPPGITPPMPGHQTLCRGGGGKWRVRGQCNPLPGPF